MNIYSDLGKIHNYRQFPQIERTHLKFLWYSDFWDGPLSGMLVYNGQKYWFEIFGEADETEDFYRRFFVIRLTSTQIEEELKWHKLFEEKVGTHTTYDENERCSLIDALRPKEMWDEFYIPYNQRQPLDITQNTLIGWFED